MYKSQISILMAALVGIACVAASAVDNKELLRLLRQSSGRQARSAAGDDSLLPYPRIGKRAAPAMLKRHDFLNFLADSWQQTGSLRNAIREIQDMTESKRSAPSSFGPIFQGPRVGKRIPVARMG